jgi:hypothetical protein
VRRIRFASLLISAVLLAGFFTAGPVRAGALSGVGGSKWTLGGVPCRLIAVQTQAPPIGVLESCDGVRPGAVVQSDAGQCTFNFLFTGSDGRRYIGTAGHCILGADGEQSWAPGSGPEARDANDQRIGEFAYAVLQDPKDFSLIRLDASVPASPQMCHFGGPTGINQDTPATPVVLNHFGQGLGLGATVPARTAVATAMPDPDHVYADGAIIFGDSGSGIISADGRAVGVIVTVGVHVASIGTSGVDAGLMGITRLAPQVARAEQVLGIGLTLQTAPLL